MHVESRAALFEAFGRCVEKLDGRFITSIDSGTSVADMDCIAQNTRFVTSTTAAGDPAPHAAMGVFAGIRTTAMARLGSDNLEGLRVAVKALAMSVTPWPSNCMPPVPSCWSATSTTARCNWPCSNWAPAIANDALLSTPCDILAPCGVGAVFNRNSVGQLRCAAVAGSASAQLTNLDIADQLEGRGILYAPDYVINSGGLIYVALKHAGTDLPGITAHLSNIGSRLTEIFAHAQAENAPRTGGR